MSDVKVQTAPKKKPKDSVAVKTHEENIKQVNIAQVYIQLIIETSSREITGVIAKKIGGDVEQTEKELLSKLLGMQDLKSSGSLK